MLVFRVGLCYTVSVFCLQCVFFRKEGFNEEWELLGECMGTRAFFAYPYISPLAGYARSLRLFRGIRAIMAKKTDNQQSQAERIGQQLADTLGYELVEAAFERENTGLYLRFYLDKEGGITLDDCERYHRAVQPLADQLEYDFLEVCSPGIDRPIKNQRDADRCLGLDIEVRLYKPQDGQKVFNGQFVAYDRGDITIRCADESERKFLKKDVAVARCAIDMEEVENADLSDDPERM